MQRNTDIFSFFFQAGVKRNFPANRHPRAAAVYSNFPAIFVVDRQSHMFSCMLWASASWITRLRQAFNRKQRIKLKLSRLVLMEGTVTENESRFHAVLELLFFYQHCAVLSIFFYLPTPVATGTLSSGEINLIFRIQ